MTVAKRSRATSAASFKMRWTARRKAEVLGRLACGEVTQEALWAYYGITAEEIAMWRRLYEADGLRALKTTRLMQYRGKAT